MLYFHIIAKKFKLHKMKKVLYVILGLVAIYLVLCLFGPSTVKVERSVDINAPKELVQTQLADLNFFHDTWSPWTEKDSAMKITYAGEMGQPGSTYAWESDKKEVGKGMMIYDQTVNDSVLQTLRFDDMGDAKVYFITKPVENATNVTWGMIFDVGFFHRGPMLFMNFDKHIGPDYERGLAKLKPVLEQMAAAPAPATYEIKEVQWEAKTYYGKKEKVSFDKMSAFFGANFSKIGEDLGKAKVQPVGMPKAIYFSYDEKGQSAECAAVMEVPNGTNVSGWEKFETPAGKVLLIEYYGPYEKSGDAHYAMDAYIKKNGLTQGLVLEEYVTDPMTEKDPSKWLTNIFYVVK